MNLLTSRAPIGGPAIANDALGSHPTDGHPTNTVPFTPTSARRYRSRSRTGSRTWSPN